MIIFFKIVLICATIYLVFNCIVDLLIIFHKETREVAIKQIEEHGLDRHVQSIMLYEFLRYLLYISILITIVTASWNITQDKTDSNTHYIEITNNK